MPIQVGVWDPVGSSYQFHCVSLYQPVRWFHPILHLARRYVVNVLCYTERLMLFWMIKTSQFCQQVTVVIWNLQTVKTTAVKEDIISNIL